MGGGPIAIFDEMGNTVIISPLDNFMSSSFWHEDHPGGRINFGVMGGAKSIPANYRQRFILLASSSINQVRQNSIGWLKVVFLTSSGQYLLHI